MSDGVVGTVKVKPLVWFEVYRGRLGGKYTADGYTIQWIEGLWLLYFAGESKSDWRFTDIESAKAAAQADYDARIMAALDVQPMDMKISLDTTHVRAMLDDAEKSVSHLTTIAATITVNALRHGATHAQIMDFITGKSDFVNWLHDQVKPKPITINDALTVPEIKALIDVASGMVDFHNAPPHRQRQDALQSKMEAIASALRAITDAD